jgi:Uncharacterized protein family UPF0029/RWD domain
MQPSSTMTTSSSADHGDDDSDLQRREEELEALLAVYGDKVVELVSHNPPHASDTSNNDSPWTRLRIHVASKVILELLMPEKYPSKEPPIPRIHAPPFLLHETDGHKLEQELMDLYTLDTEVAILWAEHCRSALVHLEEQQDDHHHYNEEEENWKQQPPAEKNATNSKSNSNQPSSNDEDLPRKETMTTTHITFVPANSRFGQPQRRFDAHVILDKTFRRTIYHGSPFHPPKAGPAELFLAHVASVECMEHVQWVLAELLLHDKKVAKASHNMFAYRFTTCSTLSSTKKDGCQHQQVISDNDDDGEKGSGSKLAALLELSKANNVLVLVSRWYGGVQLGPARFKYIASTARDVLQEHGFLMMTMEKGKKG